ncbi:Slowpoke-binding protein, partial [Penaeus vannamei]
APPPVHLPCARRGLRQHLLPHLRHHSHPAQQQGNAQGPHLQESLAGRLGREVPAEIDGPPGHAGAATGPASPGGAPVPAGPRLPSLRTPALRQRHPAERRRQVIGGGKYPPRPHLEDLPHHQAKTSGQQDAIDSVCFGHVLFEMCAGYELSAAHPTPKHLDDIAGYPQVVQVLEYIFGNGDQYPSIEEILCMDFFRNLDLREMRAAPLPSQFQIRYSPTIRNILKEVRRFQKQRSLQRRTRSLSRGETLEGDGYGRRDVRRGRRGGGTASGGEGGGGDTPTSSEASAGGTGGGADEGVAPTGSAYNTPTASLAALSSPTSDVTPSPE